jgi:hypothetical protein
MSRYEQKDLQFVKHVAELTSQSKKPIQVKNLGGIVPFSAGKTYKYHRANTAVKLGLLHKSQDESGRMCVYPTIEGYRVTQSLPVEQIKQAEDSVYSIHITLDGKVTTLVSNKDLPKLLSDLSKKLNDAQSVYIKKETMF